MSLCPGEKCCHYGKATKYPRACYYEVQCWRGYFDMFVELFKLRWRLWFQK